jgi:hypothetical protein
VVLDGEVISAPAINAASFSRDQIQISGSFDRAELERPRPRAALRLAAPRARSRRQVQTVSATLGSGALACRASSPELIGLGVVVCCTSSPTTALLGAITVASLVLTAALLMWTVVGDARSVAAAWPCPSPASSASSCRSACRSTRAIVYFENLKEDVDATAASLRSAGASFEPGLRHDHAKAERVVADRRHRPLRALDRSGEGLRLLPGAISTVLDLVHRVLLHPSRRRCSRLRSRSFGLQVRAGSASRCRL